MNFICPHCGKESDAVRIQGADELGFISDSGELRELWQCDCGGYFGLIFKLAEAVKYECCYGFYKADSQGWISSRTGGTGAPSPLVRIKTGQG